MLTLTTALMLLAPPFQDSGATPVMPLYPAAPVQVGDAAPPITAATVPQTQSARREPAPSPDPLHPGVPAPTGIPAAPSTRAGGPQHDIVVVGRKPLAGDPLRSVNATAFDATNKIDNAVIGPVARAYKKTVPSPIRRGIHNFLYNLREPVVFLNFLLQFKPGKAAETVGRFAINSTVGVAGVLDVAKKRPFRLPRRSNGFANTLGYHGVKNGPFLFLPLVGPTTLRDLLGGALDRLVLPVAVGDPFTSPTYTIPAGALGALDHRSEFDDTLKDLHENAADPYAASREFYLRRRQAEIDHLHGRGNDDILGPGGTTEPPPRAAMPIIEQRQSPTGTDATEPLVPERKPETVG